MTNKPYVVLNSGVGANIDELTETLESDGWEMKADFDVRCEPGRIVLENVTLKLPANEQ